MECATGGRPLSMDRLCSGCERTAETKARSGFPRIGRLAVRARRQRAAAVLFKSLLFSGRQGGRKKSVHFMDGFALGKPIVGPVLGGNVCIFTFEPTTDRVRPVIHISKERFDID